MRAGWRLARCLVHIGRGLLICALVFPLSGDAQRMRRVGAWSRQMLAVLGVRLRARATPRAGGTSSIPPASGTSSMPQAGGTLWVANHVSWLDILAINAVRPVRFVSKADVRRWPLLGWLVACGGTLFIERERKRDAMRVVHLMADALRAGDTLAVFPEGTTSDGHGLLPFHANLLQPAVSTGVPVQPVALRYADDREPVSRAAAFIGEQTLAASLWAVLTASGLTVTLTLLPVQRVDALDRRSLAERLRNDIGAALPISAGVPETAPSSAAPA